MLKPKPEGEILGRVEILGDGTVVDLRRVNRNLDTMPKPKEVSEQKARERCLGRLLNGKAKPKPDEDRLLSSEQLKDLISPSSDKLACCMAVRNMQDARTAAIKDAECQQKIERIFKEIGKHPLCQTVGLFAKPVSLDDCGWWQSLKKREGISLKAGAEK